MSRFSFCEQKVNNFVCEWFLGKLESRSEVSVLITSQILFWIVKDQIFLLVQSASDIALQKPVIALRSRFSKKCDEIFPFTMGDIAAIPKHTDHRIAKLFIVRKGWKPTLLTIVFQTAVLALAPTKHPPFYKELTWLKFTISLMAHRLPLWKIWMNG